MAKTPKNVQRFLKELSFKLQVLWKKEKNVMLDMKQVEANELGFDFDGNLAAEDLKYT